MNLTDFYSETLGANLKNQQWSWGAKDPISNRIFLRVWKDEIQSTADGERVVVALDVPRRKSNGYPERLRHVAEIKDGAEGFGVVCEAKDFKTLGKRTIKRFNAETLLRFGDFEHEVGVTYARILGRVSVNEITRQRTSQTTLAGDIESILKKNVDPTTKEALVNARVGQGKFRVQVLQLWQHRCCVTGALTLDAIRASHIKPWRESTDDERLDPHNGLPLTANLDALFDAGLITFTDSGTLVVSQKLSSAERDIFRVHECSLTKAPSPETAKYLAYHRDFRYIE